MYRVPFLRAFKQQLKTQYNRREWLAFFWYHKKSWKVLSAIGKKTTASRVEVDVISVSVFIHCDCVFQKIN